MVSTALFGDLREAATPVGRRINPWYLADEAALVGELCAQADCGAATRHAVERRAEQLVRAVRRDRRSKSGLDGLLHQYDLSSAEGVALMCLAEALLRIPDGATADLLIADRLQAGEWAEHLGDSESLFVNASTWALMLTGELLQPDAGAVGNPAGFLRQLAARMGEPLARAALRHAMRVIAGQFVMGRDIDEAMTLSRQPGNDRYRYSFDMLGEAALTHQDAGRYCEAYHHAITRLGSAWGPGREPASVSVKLSALHPRFEWAQRRSVMASLVPRLVELARVAMSHGVSITLDAEEAAVLELQLAVFEAASREPALRGWDGLGVAVQAYQRRAGAVIGWLAELAAGTARRIPVRLVKGAYWDSEIKHAQEAGLASYPVFTRKVNTDVSWLACARQLLDTAGRLAPQFATHNAHAVAWIAQLAGDAGYEFQRLHGMGEALYDEVLDSLGLPCRVYAPVGRHEDLLPYLVRRLLENGANSSFVNRIVQDEVPVADIIGDPVLQARRVGVGPHPGLPSPAELFGAARRNSAGVNLADSLALEALGASLAEAAKRSYRARPLIDGMPRPGTGPAAVTGPCGTATLGTVEFAEEAHAAAALDSALDAFPSWSAVPVGERSRVLRRAADLVEAARTELASLCIREAGRCLADALDEVRETVDFLRYYAAEAKSLMAQPMQLPGPTGERNELRWRPRGVFVCISPWNFPLAIFTGQVAAALVTGNTVVAKPAEQTSLVAARVVEILLEAGIAPGALQFLPGDGTTVGARLTTDPRIAGVVFTGSTATARSIHRSLAEHAGPAAVLIAETGGLNALVADSSALPEQVVRDAMRSAFNSAGQRCSALRILAVQEEIAPRVIELLQGRMAELRIGDPADLATDIGPVIDVAAVAALARHRERMRAEARILYECPPPAGPGTGHFFPPVLVEIQDISVVKEEVFGPILHLFRFPASGWSALLEAINATGYGLTGGLHSRVERRAREFADRMLAGNVYVNRNLIGAVVGVQPFGGRGLSGTGPKAGGPHYLARFVTEQTITTNTAAIGGNVQLLGDREG
jgi:RHH-type proline utilization regulon transcriptional repressor/proline dehydrogenase/delta 1-pyrroline-5-carboxylate dehydrogenase